MITLRPVNQDNFNEVIKLSVTKEQEGFIASNMYSLAQAYANQLEDDPADHLITFAIYCNNEMVGFAMAGYWAADENEHKNDD